MSFGLEKKEKRPRKPTKKRAIKASENPDAYPLAVRQWCELDEKIFQMDQEHKRQVRELFHKKEELLPEIIRHMKDHGDFTMSGMSADQVQKYGAEGKLRYRDDIPVYPRITFDVIQDYLPKWLKEHFLKALPPEYSKLVAKFTDQVLHNMGHSAARFISESIPREFKTGVFRTRPGVEKVVIRKKRAKPVSNADDDEDVPERKTKLSVAPQFSFELQPSKLVVEKDFKLMPYIAPLPTVVAPPVPMEGMSIPGIPDLFKSGGLPVERRGGNTPPRSTGGNTPPRYNSGGDTPPRYGPPSFPIVKSNS